MVHGDQEDLVRADNAAASPPDCEPHGVHAADSLHLDCGVCRQVLIRSSRFLSYQPFAVTLVVPFRDSATLERQSDVAPG